MKHFICVLFVLCFCLRSKGQDVSVRAGFFADSVAIGEPTKYYLAVQYPSSLNIVFPDSTYDFKPFEYESKQYFPTVTKDSISYDSVIYSLSTFEVDRLQNLQLPVFVINRTDSTKYAANLDAILLNEMVHSVPDSLSADKLPLKMSRRYRHWWFSRW